MAEYENTNRGALFPAENQKIIRSGPMNINGSDHQCSIVQVSTKNGKTFFEVYQKIGVVFINDNKKDENDADMNGTIETKSGEMKIWGRKKKSKNGHDYTSISLSESRKQYSNNYPKTQASVMASKDIAFQDSHMNNIANEDDEIPF